MSLEDSYGLWQLIFIHQPYYGQQTLMLLRERQLVYYQCKQKKRTRKFSISYRVSFKTKTEVLNPIRFVFPFFCYAFFHPYTNRATNPTAITSYIHITLTLSTLIKNSTLNSTKSSFTDKVSGATAIHFILFTFTQTIITNGVATVRLKPTLYHK
jgi:hypothetical protein